MMGQTVVPVRNSAQQAVRCDGDTLIASLPAIVDDRIFPVLQTLVSESAPRSYFYALLDFSGVEALPESGMLSLTRAARLLRENHIRMLVLDVPGHLHRRLSGILNDAFWIDQPERELVANRRAGRAA